MYRLPGNAYLRFVHRIPFVRKAWIAYAAVAGFCALALAFVRCSPAPVSAAHEGYTGAASCQPCHAEIAAQYAQTPMGHSFYRPDPAQVIERFGPDVVVQDPFFKLSYHPFWRGDSLFIREFRLQGKDTLYRREEKIDYIIGSGHQTRSYLLMRNGYLFEAPITWYVNKSIWDLSPGYHQGQNSRFDREIGEECMACHTSYADYVPGSKNRFRSLPLGIDCENCHGPGAAHIAQAQAGKTGAENLAIVNPARLDSDRSFDICQRCHLEGVTVFKAGKGPRDFRPGMDFSKMADVFLTLNQDPEAFGIASHVERLRQSKCYTASAGAMSCTTCHPAHAQPAGPKAYVQRCGQCHQPDKVMCAAPEAMQLAVQGDCVSCHMPQGPVSDIPHVSFHDHRIRIVSPAAQAAAAQKSFVQQMISGLSPEPGPAAWAEAWLQRYEREAPDPAFLEAAMKWQNGSSDFTKAKLALHKGQAAVAENLLAQLPAAQQQEEARFLLATALEAQGKTADAARHYAGLWQQNPEMTEAGFRAALCLLQAQPGDTAALRQAGRWLEQLCAMRPFDARLHTNLGFVALNQRDYEAANHHLIRALALNPDEAQALENAAWLQHRRGRRADALQYLQRLSAADPAHHGLPALRAALGQ